MDAGLARRWLRWSLLSLALGISATIGIVAVLAIGARSFLGIALVHWLPQIERGSLVLQRLAALTIIAIGLYTLSVLRA